MKQSEEKSKRSLKFSFFSFHEGLIEYDHVSCIRVKGKHYTLLIMLDHTPCIGELEGNISVLLENEEIEMEGVDGFYILQHNEFHFLEKGNFNIKNDAVNMMEVQEKGKEDAGADQ